MSVARLEVGTYLFIDIWGAKPKKSDHILGSLMRTVLPDWTTDFFQ